MSESILAATILETYKRYSAILRPLKNLALHFAPLRNIHDRLVRAATAFEEARVVEKPGLASLLIRNNEYRDSIIPSLRDLERATLCLSVWSLFPSEIRGSENYSIETFAVKYIAKRKYRCPVTKVDISAEAALAIFYLSVQSNCSPFFQETVLRSDIDREAIQPNSSSFEESVFALDQMSPVFLDDLRASPFGSVFVSLARSESISKCLEAVAISIKLKAFISLFSHLIIFLRNQVKYDYLRDVVSFYIKWFDDIHETVGARDSIRFMEFLVVGIKNLNGRTVDEFPRCRIDGARTERELRLLSRLYFRLALGMLRYDVANATLDSYEETDPSVLFSLAQLTYQLPFRVEREPEKRVNIRRRIALRLETAIRSDDNLPVQIAELAFHLAVGNRDCVQEAVCDLEGECMEFTESRDRPYSSLVSAMLSKLIQLNFLREGKCVLSLLQPLMTLKDVQFFEVRLGLASNEHNWKVPPAKIRSPAVSQFMTKLAGGSAWKQCKFFEAYLYFASARSPNDKLEKTVALESTLERLKFLGRTSQIVNVVRQPENPKGVILLASLNCFNTLAMLAPVLVALKKEGFAVGSLLEGVLDSPPIKSNSELGRANQLFNSIKQDRADGNIELEWHIDWSSRIVVACGVNFYQGIYERLSTKFRRATITLNDSSEREHFDRLLLSCDYVLRRCLSIENLANSTEKPIILLGSNGHVSPYSVFRDFALAKSISNLRYVSASVAYENYYSNLGSKFSGSMAIVDMTLHRTCRAPFLALRHRFESWYEQNADSGEIRERFLQLVSENRNLKAEESASPYHETIVSAKNSGKRVICCFGKVLCDLAVPYDGGPAHRDMADWLQHSVETVADQDILLLIKPHPHELRPEIALDLTEKLEDLLPRDLPENVILLGHKDYNVHEIIQYIDLAVLWNGTSCLELTGLGVPVIMCSHFGRHDYPIDLLYPTNRESYAKMLLAEPFVPPCEPLRKKAMALLHYMGTEDVAIPNSYSRRPITNDSVGIPRWDEEKLTTFFEQGDDYVKLAVDRILEGC
ncbi:hypothetical protein [Microbulbifer rhizosphaerae]|uniref:Capsule polysaccharide biosynthesis protein n=1 Tax=Microbulbifer rhizosphaerae TaxID=1562603 RepID=A0A7W4WH49_9GAMM|nr:hypothetical protein [Microbulbifer rhizosphaerae]MBB3063667.1 hypothetical protein [Microbulbifer rhizosphaerae]